jgi:hypothetical protein
MYTEPTKNEIIREHLMRFYSVALEHGYRGRLQKVEEYAGYFESMFKGLYIKDLERRINQENRKAVLNANDNEVHPASVATEFKFNIQD